VANYTDDDRKRLAVKPGITGWAQVNGRDNLTWPERFELDRWYVQHWSLWLDLRILWMTVATLNRGEAPVLVDDLNISRLRRLDGG
jgi:lipopolysaccharide/colanic/teichoic acid biosynthesis glycosyltransferase